MNITLWIYRLLTQFRIKIHFISNRETIECERTWANKYHIFNDDACDASGMFHLLMEYFANFLVWKKFFDELFELLRYLVFKIQSHGRFFSTQTIIHQTERMI